MTNKDGTWIRLLCYIKKVNLLKANQKLVTKLFLTVIPLTQYRLAITFTVGIMEKQGNKTTAQSYILGKYNYS